MRSRPGGGGIFGKIVLPGEIFENCYTGKFLKIVTLGKFLKIVTLGKFLKKLLEGETLLSS
jgi:hypothetical protein